MIINYSTVYSNHIEAILSKSPQHAPFFVTKSFKPFLSDSSSSDLRRVTKHVFSENDRLYRDITSRLMNNFCRKHHLHPPAFHFFDLPNSQRQQDVDFDKPEVPHIHSIYLVHHATLAAFRDLALAQKFEPITNSVRSLIQARIYPSLISIDAKEIADPGRELSKTVAYAAKLLDHPYSQHLMSDDCCFFSQNPKAASEKSVSSPFAQASAERTLNTQSMLNESRKRLRTRLEVKERQKSRFTYI